MKKILVLAMIATMTIVLVGCGGDANTADNGTDTVIEENSNLDETEETNDSTEAKSETEETVEAAFPEVKGVSRKFNYELVGMEMTKAYGGDEDVLRLWFMVTNDGDRAATPDDIVTRDILVAYQGETVTNPFIPFQDGVELKLGHPMEEDDNIDIQINAKIAAGETKQIAQTYVLYNESSPVIAMLNKSGNVYGTVYNLK